MKYTTRFSHLRRLVGQRLAVIAVAQLTLGASACVDEGEEPPALTGVVFSAQPAPAADVDAGDAGAADAGNP